MDSGNSGSMQSSSGGDEEYDSGRADSISAFFNTPGGLASFSHQYHTRAPSTSLHHNPPNAASTSSPPLFDPFYVYFDGLARSPPTLTSSSSPLRSLDMPWPPRGIGPSNPSSCTDVAGLMATASPPSSTTGTALSFPMGAGRDLFSGGVGVGFSPLPSSSRPVPLQHQPSSAPPPQNPATAAAGAATGAAPPRSSKKRSRASRRASTTVLTTDTSNFRAMVQEFTGLPAPPFSSSPFPRARFDLFHAAASSVMRSSAMSDASPHYLLRPFAQQLPALSSGPLSLGSSSAPSFAPSAIIPGTVRSTENVVTSLVNATTIAATASTSLTSAIPITNTTSVTTASAAISTNTASTASYQLPSDHLGLQSQHHQSLPSMFDYTSLAQSFPSTKYSSASVPPMVGSKKASPGGTPPGASTADYTVASGFRHGHADARLATTQSSTEPTGLTPSRGGGGGESAGDDLLLWVEGPAGGSDRGDPFRPGAGGSCSGSQRGSTCKLNYGGTSSSSDYHAEKGADNGSSTRGEGMVESWICSSD